MNYQQVRSPIVSSSSSLPDVLSSITQGVQTTFNEEQKPSRLNLHPPPPPPPAFRQYSERLRWYSMEAVRQSFPSSFGPCSNQLETSRSAERMLNRWGNTSCALEALMSCEITAFATVLGLTVEVFRPSADMRNLVRGESGGAGWTMLHTM
jgi:hypothetical protein